jgi:beta-mannosidase
MTTINLHGIWKLRCEARGIEVDYPVPGDVHSALIAAGQIPDPYKGTNEFACRWVADEEWVARRIFSISNLQKKAEKYVLSYDYLDTVATIKLNGKTWLQSENCFQDNSGDVTKFLREGENIIEIILHSNTKAANAKQEGQPFYVPYHVGNSPIPNGNMLRKPQCHFGWDWNLAIVPLGICGNLKLLRTNKKWVESIDCDGFIDENGKATICVYVRPNTPVEDGEFEYEYWVDGRHSLSRCPDSLLVQIENPKFWWPVGYGEQNLYEVKIRFDDQYFTRKVGLRKIELIDQADMRGRRFAFKVNDREIFCKGANWIPADALPSRATPELTRKLLQAAVDANMNMIRVWGGGYYEQDWFYDICDELGILVWQDFMFSCNLYPATEDFLRQVRHEVQCQIQRLGHHACIALWCGDNELIGALTWFDESRKNRDRYLVSYDRLNRTIEQAAKSVDEFINWWPSSPSPGVLDFGDAWHDDSKGDMHFWSVWHEGKDFEHYYDVKPRFCSEFGFQSFPSLRICKEFVETEEDLNISSAVMEHHQRNKGGNARIAETMFRYFRFPMDFGNFVYLSQVQQGLAMRMAVEYWRSLKPHCMGTLYWQLNDTWPVASWSGLDHGGGWKLLHYMARRFYAPILVTARRADDDIIISTVHDLHADHSTDINIQFIAMDGTAKPLFKQHVRIEDKGQEITRLDRRRLVDGIVMFSWIDEKGVVRRNHISPVPYKHLALPDPGIQHVITENNGEISIKLTAQNLALYVALECDVAGHFSDNAFDLLADESITITFTPDFLSDLNRARDTLVIRDLYSSSH